MSEQPTQVAILSAGMRDMLPVLDKPAAQRVIEHFVRIGYRRILVLGDDHSTAVRDFLGSGERWGVSIEHHARQPGLSTEGHRHALGLTADTPCGIGDLSSLPPSDDDPGFSVATDREYLEAGLRLLRERTTSLPGAIDVARSATVHPDAVLEGPVYIGAHCRVMAGAHIGPEVILGQGSVVEAKTHLRECTVLPDTHIGPSLDIRHAIAAPGMLSSISNEVCVTGIDSHLLGPVTLEAGAHSIQPAAPRAQKGFFRRLFSFK
ncbi:MAG: hypothetical protein RLZZ200_414 [Pseudomonadota bacterium]|jgi:NDP-sugar pyrophosphorylase family protein